MRVNHREPDQENHDKGLDHDLPRLLHRRGMLKLVAGAGLAGGGLVVLGACAPASPTTAPPGPDGAPSGAPRGGPPSGGPRGGPPSGGPGGGPPPENTATSDTANGELPEETAGPYPGDGSNGANVLADSGIVRSDLTSSFGSSSTRAEGVPLSLAMTFHDFARGKQALAGAAVYVWHCSRSGEYSLYSEAVRTENYLRGVQQTDAAGLVRFRTIFPACYPGRWPHIHFEVYPSLRAATSSANKIATSQLALPEAESRAVYATTGYEASVDNLARVTLASDNVFGDGYDLQVPTLTGSPTGGYALTFSCAV